MNILSNAIDVLQDESLRQCSDFTPTIKIHTEAIADRWILIQISDNGLGMTEDTQRRIFDPFFTTKPIGQGTGLGLSISYQIIVEQHRGKLNCYSQPGQGTEFQIQIPIHRIVKLH